MAGARLKPPRFDPGGVARASTPVMLHSRCVSVATYGSITRRRSCFDAGDVAILLLPFCEVRAWPASAAARPATRLRRRGFGSASTSRSKAATGAQATSTRCRFPLHRVHHRLAKAQAKATGAAAILIYSSTGGQHGHGGGQRRGTGRGRHRCFDARCTGSPTSPAVECAPTWPVAANTPPRTGWR